MWSLGLEQRPVWILPAPTRTRSEVSQGSLASVHFTTTKVEGHNGQTGRGWDKPAFFRTVCMHSCRCAGLAKCQNLWPRHVWSEVAFRVLISKRLEKQIWICGAGHWVVASPAHPYHTWQQDTKSVRDDHFKILSWCSQLGAKRCNLPFSNRGLAASTHAVTDWMATHATHLSHRLPTGRTMDCWATSDARPLFPAFTLCHTRGISSWASAPVESQTGLGPMDMGTWVKVTKKL